MAPRFIFEILRILEMSLAKAQGKGYGTATVDSEVKSIKSLLRGGQVNTCVDIGGNIGNYTQALNRQFPNADIFTFEPSKTNIDHLNNRFKDHSSIRILPYAVSDDIGEATLHSNTPGSGLGSLTKRDLDHIGIEFEVTEQVKTVRFEDFWKSEMNSRDIDIMKLDIEGHELAALKGCGDAIRATRIIQFEFGGCNIDTHTYFRDFWHFFQENGFKLYRVAPIGEMPITRYKERDEFFATTNYLAVRN